MVICSAMPLGFFFPSGPKLGEGAIRDIIEAADKWNMTAKIRYRFFKYRLTKRGRSYFHYTNNNSSPRFQQWLHTPLPTDILSFLTKSPGEKHFMLSTDKSRATRRLNRLLRPQATGKPGGSRPEPKLVTSPLVTAQESAWQGAQRAQHPVLSIKLQTETAQAKRPAGWEAKPRSEGSPSDRNPCLVGGSRWWRS